MGRVARGHLLPSCPLLGGKGELGKRKGDDADACREDVPCPSFPRRGPLVPPPQALRSLPCPSLFIGPASRCLSVWLALNLLLPISGDGDRSEDAWVSLRRKEKNQVFCCRLGKIGRKRRRKLVLQSALNTNDFTE